jgi:hypothetical protein
MRKRKGKEFRIWDRFGRELFCTEVDLALDAYRWDLGHVSVPRGESKKSVAFSAPAGFDPRARGSEAWRAATGLR